MGWGVPEDWRSVLRETCRYLEVVGGVFKPIHVGALWMISGTALNLIVMQRLISDYHSLPILLQTVYGAYPFTFFEFYRALDPTGTNDQ
jgi:hypothetical protein